MKTLLVFPPCWHPIMPHLALPSLTAYLRSQELDVVQMDLNIETFDELLSERHLGTVMQQLERDQRRNKLTDDIPDAQHEQLIWMLENGHRIVNDVEDAKATLRSDRFYDPEKGLYAFLTLTEGLSLASTPHLPTQIHFTGYDSPYPVDASQAILAAIRDRQHNIFYNLFQRVVIPQIIRQQPDIVGISITSARQVIASFTLAHLIRQAGIKTHITLGGKMVTCWRDQLPEASDLSYLFDSLVTFAGEQALLRLIEALDSGKDLSRVPNLIYREDHEIKRTETEEPEPIDQLPLPDFEGLPLHKYLAPEPVLPISASRGCYWHRCAFCNIGHGESRRYEEKAAQRVFEEMQSLSTKWNIKRFFFSDEAVSPRILKSVSNHLLESDLNLKWTAAARFEPGLDGEALEPMAEAGCRMLMYGLESGAQRTLDRMQKGTKLQIVERILHDGAEAGIWNHLFFFFGFPGETLEEAQETINFVYAHSDEVNSVCSGTFMLEKYAEVETDPDAYGVTEIIQPSNRDLSYYYSYKVAEGLAASQAQRVEAFVLDALPEKDKVHLYYHDIYRFLYACQLEPPFPSFLEE